MRVRVRADLLGATCLGLSFREAVVPSARAAIPGILRFPFFLPVWAVGNARPAETWLGVFKASRSRAQQSSLACTAVALPQKVDKVLP
jgi:hypothetical protein